MSVSHLWIVGSQQRTWCGLPITDDMALSPNPTCEHCLTALDVTRAAWASLHRGSADMQLRFQLAASAFAPELQRRVDEVTGRAGRLWSNLSPEERHEWGLRAEAVLKVFVEPSAAEQLRANLRLVKGDAS